MNKLYEPRQLRSKRVYHQPNNEFRIIQSEDSKNSKMDAIENEDQDDEHMENLEDAAKSDETGKENQVGSR